MVAYEWSSLMVSTKSFLGRRSLVLALLCSVALGAMTGAFNIRPARASSPQTYVIQVGAGSIGNIDLMQFAPGTLKVHRGDTVTWLINGFHNVHVGAKAPASLIIVADSNGKPVPQINPQVAMPYGAKSGSAFTGQETGSGLPGPQVSPVFSLVIDVAPGTSFAFFCDVHPGMVGNITVVNDNESIPTPSEVSVQAGTELGASAQAASASEQKLEADASKSLNSTNGGATVQMGDDLGRAAVDQYFPSTSIVKVGESVTWKFANSAIEPHTVSFPAVRGEEAKVIPQPGKAPVLALGPSLALATNSGASIKVGDQFSSGLLAPIPGKLPTFTLTFSQPGVYLYACNLHPGMNGTVVVLAK